MVTPPDYDLGDLSTFGRKFIVEPGGPILLDSEKELLDQLQPAGVMLRSRNFIQDAPYPVWLDQLTNLLQDIRAHIRRPDLIIAIDHEGGRIIRPPLPITRFPYASAYKEATGAVAGAMAKELKSIGVNLSFSPVADIHSNAANPVINERAFGQEVDTVCNYATQYYTELKEYGVEGCAKHFPGHGDTSVDSHFELPFLEFDLKQLKHRELAPFQTLIDAGIGMVMTGHLMLPALDQVFPATLSTSILRDLLRTEMKFNGVIISDGLGMDAIRNTLSSRESVLQGITASLDLFLVAGDTVTIADAVKWADDIRIGVKDELIEASLITESVSRIDRFTSTLSQHTPCSLSEEVLHCHWKLANDLAPGGQAGRTPELHGFT